MVSGETKAFVDKEDKDVKTHREMSIRKQKTRIQRNVCAICFSFLCVFTALGGISFLQSSLNATGGLGVISLAIMYGAFTVSSLVSPTLLIEYIGVKWTMTVSIIAYILYYVANLYPTWSTLLLTSVLIGAAAAPLWTGASSYITTSASSFALLSGEKNNATVSRFFGLFYFIVGMEQIFGNTISSFILSSSNTTGFAFPSNFSATRIETYCGNKACQDGFGYNETQSEVAVENVTMLIGVFVGLGVFGFLVMALAVDNIIIQSSKQKRSTKKLMLSTIKHMKEKEQLFLIVLTFYTGSSQAFIMADFTKSYLACPLGINWIGFTMISFGVSSSICCFVFGVLTKYTGRVPLMCAASLSDLFMLFGLQLWIPYPNDPILFFVLPAIFGISRAAWKSQISALYGVLFSHKQSEAFSNFKLWQSLGYTIPLAYQNYICVDVKIYIQIITLVTGMILYFILEARIRKSKHKEKAEKNQEVKELPALVESGEK